VCRYSWRVPENFRGKYQVQIELDLGPIETELDKTWYVID